MSSIFYCLEVKNFWLSLNEWLMFEHDIQISISLKSILFGELDTPDFHKKTMLYAKLFIFKCNCKENVPLLNRFILWVKQYRILSSVERQKGLTTSHFHI